MFWAKNQTIASARLGETEGLERGEREDGGSRAVKLQKGRRKDRDEQKKPKGLSQEMTTSH